MRPPSPPCDAYRAGVRRRVVAALADHGLGLSAGDLAAARADVERVGADLYDRLLASGGGVRRRVWERGAASLGVSVGAQVRLLGFGGVQAHAFRPGVGWPRRATDVGEVGEVGALFNLGVVLFDHALDWGAAGGRGAPPLDVAGLRRLAAGGPAGEAGSPGAAFVADVVAGVLRGLSGLLAPPSRRAVERDLERMLEAEVSSASARGGGPVPAAAWRALARKSVGPWEVLGRVAGGAGSAGYAAAVGGAVWIVDDLWDAAEDWEAGTWSRPWGLLSRCRPLGALAPGAALEALGTAGVVEREDVRLRRALGALAGAPPVLRRSVAATLACWVPAQGGRR